MKHITFTVIERDGMFRVSLLPPKSLIVKNPLTPTASSRDAGPDTKRCVELLEDWQRDIMEFASDKHW